MASENRSSPKMVLQITQKEKDVAKAIKADFKKILRKMNAAIRIISDLRDAIVNQRPEKTDLMGKYSGRLLRYRRKIKKSFNEFLQPTKVALEKISKIQDPGMLRLREIIIAEVGELSGGAESIMDVLRETDRDGFTQRIEEIASQMERRCKSIVDVIDTQLFNHIDHDILGRLRISELKFKIMRRARITKQLIRGIHGIS